MCNSVTQGSYLMLLIGNSVFFVNNNNKQNILKINPNVNIFIGRYLDFYTKIRSVPFKVDKFVLYASNLSVREKL